MSELIDEYLKLREAYHISDATFVTKISIMNISKMVSFINTISDNEFMEVYNYESEGYPNNRPYFARVLFGMRVRKSQRLRDLVKIVEKM